MRTYDYVTADVFTDRQFGGNQLAVLLDARDLSSEQMLDIAREFNYSETTFVLPPERGGAAKVRIFTPGGEVPFAGHPTIGTAHVLFATGALTADGTEATILLEEQVGDVPVKVRLPHAAVGAGVEPTFAQLSVAQLPEEREAPSRALLADALGLREDDILDGAYAPRMAGCGLPFVLVPLASHDAVRRARVRHEAWERALPPDAWTREPMVFAMGAPDEASARAGVDVHARVFVPGLSVPEDPATGSANAALAGYLAARTPRLDGTLRWVVAQGIEMGRPSRLELEADKQGGEITAVRVGGSAVVVSEGRLRLRPRA
ncbi:PhzF family phenazine biosynthesis protein [Roseisolibacter sp. H3M3-2]|uniref:PhzF family phenazine biosynthesis protein n=1 Tax=Roseisolibacter sp. H3M3-2 TaxID=3031323 RepID=UPI0023DB8DB5|nr:PhzF family phenazine biosynthesis protein [Roseisolibacter sp. H3M3-2]MDF1504911.1 PhzF family phenazine biosynthesis protein [Roseisolibacter sp. H3M3-2]